MAAFVDLTGRTFTYLKVIRRASNSKANAVMWLCRCECGTEKPVKAAHLVGKMVKSCGCKRGELVRNSLNGRTHGQTGTALYRVWQYMKDCCYNEKNVVYPLYHATGVRVVNRWLGPAGFATFKRDMGERPKGCVLDRKDSTKPFGPDNCLWSPKGKKSSLRRNAKVIEFRGRTQTVQQWADEFGYTKSSLYGYIYRYPHLDLAEIQLMIKAKELRGTLPPKEKPPNPSALVSTMWSPPR